MKRSVVGLLAALTTSLLLPLPTSAYYYDVYTYSYASQQDQSDPNSHFECVAASTVNWINAIRGWTDYTHTPVLSYYNEAINGGYNKYNKFGQGSDLYGIDPRGWAWLMFYHSPNNYTYNDYIYDDHVLADEEIVYGLIHTGEYVGVLLPRATTRLTSSVLMRRPIRRAAPFGL